MSSENYLDGYIYHMVRFDNLRSIFKRRAILSKESVIQEVIEYQSIAYEEVQNLRDRIFVWDFSKRIFQRTFTAMSLFILQRSHQCFLSSIKMAFKMRLVIFEVSRSILGKHRVLFTNGNAGNQQLSKYSHEVVDIMPATAYP